MSTTMIRSNLYNRWLFVYLMFVTSWGCSQPQENIQLSVIEYVAETVSDDFEHPWSFTFLAEDDLLVTEKEGKLYRLNESGKTEVSGLPSIYVRGQGGLMDIETHPDFGQNQWIYFACGISTDEAVGGNTAVFRAKLRGNTLEDAEEIFRAFPNSKKGQHWGGRIIFDKNGYLFVSVGDRGARDANPQSLANLSGKIHRLHDDGSVPIDNPFRNGDGSPSSIYTYGHRNPQGLALHPETGEIWSHEHGPKGGDELNLIIKGANYGWPVITYGRNYSGTKITDLTEKEGMLQPIHYWVPSIAPCGMTFVTSDKYPELAGSILLGSLKFKYIHRCVMQDNKVIMHEKLLDGFGRMRSIKQSPDGYLYFSVEGKGVFKLSKKTS